MLGCPGYRHAYCGPPRSGFAEICRQALPCPLNTGATEQSSACPAQFSREGRRAVYPLSSTQSITSRQTLADAGPCASQSPCNKRFGSAFCQNCYMNLGLPPRRARLPQQDSRRSASRKPSMLQSASRPHSPHRSSPCRSAAAAPSLGLLLLEGPSRPGVVSAHLVTQALSHSRCLLAGGCAS